MASIKEKAEARLTYHRELQIKNHVSSTGKCFSCGENVLKDLSLEEAMKSYITGCNKCHRSFVS